MKQVYKTILFLVLLWICDVLLRAGLIAHLLPFLPIPPQIGGLLYYCLFVAIALWLTVLFGRWDHVRFSGLGISLGRSNRLDFFVGLLIGVIFWGMISYCQSLFGNFTWALKDDILISSLLYGLFFIFIADLGTELFTRAYPLTRLRDVFGPTLAIVFMSIFVGVKSYSGQVSGELLMYSILIPVLHTVFFSIIYLRTQRLGGALGVHTGANFVTISIFDLDGEQPGELIPHGFLQADVDMSLLSIHDLQMPYVVGAILFSILVFYLWPKDRLKDHDPLTNKK